MKKLLSLGLTSLVLLTNIPKSNANPAVLAPVAICAGTAGIGCVLIGTAVVGGVVYYIWQSNDGRKITATQDGRVVKQEKDNFNNHNNNEPETRAFLKLIRENKRQCKPCDNEDINLKVYINVCEPQISSNDIGHLPNKDNITVGQFIDLIYKNDFKNTKHTKLWQQLFTTCFVCDSSGNVIRTRGFSNYNSPDSPAAHVPNLHNKKLKEAECILAAYKFKLHSVSGEGYRTYKYNNQVKITIKPTGQVSRTLTLPGKGGVIRYTQFGTILNGANQNHDTGEIVKL